MAEVYSCTLSKAARSWYIVISIFVKGFGVIGYVVGRAAGLRNKMSSKFAKS